jgi:hypothetical protein
MLGAPYVTQFNHMVYMESSVVFVGTVITIQSSYCIFVAAIEVHTKRSIKAK